MGGGLLAHIPSLSHLEGAVRAMHERWDGAGYPDGLYGRTIPLASRIVFVCDAYDAMVSPRPYRTALVHDVAIDEIRRCSGTQFCPVSAQALIAVLAFEHDTVPVS
jgi:HD-GYP domain-containing protein (c-di-GMP phosphodiesterase class II)